MIKSLRKECTEKGFDLCDPFHTKWYNDLIEKEGHVAKGTLNKIPESLTLLEEEDGNCNSSYNAVLIGNSKTIWPKFISWLSLQYKKKLTETDDCDKEDVMNRMLEDNPFDRFVIESMSQALYACCSRESESQTDSDSRLDFYEVFWSNGRRDKVEMKNTNTETESTSAFKNKQHYHCFVSDDKCDDARHQSFLVSMQRVAKVTGKFWHDEMGTKLCVHPRFGTWKAFRAVVVFHKTQKSSRHNSIPVPDAPPLCTCPVSPEEIDKAKGVMEYALKVSSPRGEDGKNKQTYGGLCAYLHNSVTSGSDWSKVSPAMRPWIQLRDCITVGQKDYKYCDNQILYHYTKDTDILKNELRNQY